MGLMPRRARCACQRTKTRHSHVRVSGRTLARTKHTHTRASASRVQSTHDRTKISFCLFFPPRASFPQGLLSEGGRETVTLWNWKMWSMGFNCGGTGGCWSLVPRDTDLLPDNGRLSSRALLRGGRSPSLHVGDSTEPVPQRCLLQVSFTYNSGSSEVCSPRHPRPSQLHCRGRLSCNHQGSSTCHFGK